jgi:uncharacterized protein (DUF983 family)
VTRSRIGTMLRRGLTRRCPRCGTGRLFTGWFRMAERCPGCGMRFSREEGFFIGALFVNFAVTEGVLFAWLVAAFLLTLPDAPVLLIAAGAVVVCAVVPLLCYPFSKTIWAAIHLAMEPLNEVEQADAAAHRFERGDAA